MTDRTVPMRCPAEGCRDYRYVPYRNARERHEISQRSYPCLRHQHPERIVGPGHPVEAVFVATDRGTLGRYWGREGDDRPAPLGVLACDAFLAYAADVPAGSRLVVTARIEAAGDTS